MSKCYNVAVIGCGIGRSHIEEAYSKLTEKYHVRVICDLNDERLAAVGDEFDVPFRINDFEAVLTMPDIDIIDICTPPMLHVPQTLAALKAGKHVVCEKPIAANLADIDQLIAAEAAATNVVMPIFQYRWGAGFQKARHLVETGMAGRPYVATVETHWRRTPAYYSVPWRGKFETELGGVLVTHSIHLHDMLCVLMGPIRSVSANLATRTNAIEVEDCLAANLEMESGALVTLSATLGSATDTSRFRFCFEHASFESCRLPYRPGDDPWTIDIPDEERKPAMEAALAALTPLESRFLGQMRDFHATLEAGAPPPVTLGDARRSLELVTALYHAHDTGGRVMLPLGADHPKYHDWRPTRALRSARGEA